MLRSVSINKIVLKGSKLVFTRPPTRWNSQNIISYRGTNADFGGSVTEFLSSPGAQDIWDGWSLGAGFSSAHQGGLAIQCYNAVAGVSSVYDNSLNGETMLLGHLFGDGLAGFVASLSAGTMKDEHMVENSGVHNT